MRDLNCNVLPIADTSSQVGWIEGTIAQITNGMGQVVS